MKLFLFTFLVFFFVACAPKQDNGSEIAELKDQVAALLAQQNSSNQSIASLTVELQRSLSMMKTLENQLAAVSASSQANEYQVYELAGLISDLQTMVMNQQAAITQLSTGLSIVKVIDFCDTHPYLYNEVGFRLSDGSTVVFFENGGNRFLTLLKPSSSYKTTDGTNCNFTTNAAGLVCDNQGCR